MSNLELSFTRLSADYDLAAFDCGDGELNEFLAEDALRYQSQFLANTTLILLEGDLVAYFSLASDALRLSLDEKELGGINAPLRHLPAIKIARLATDARHQRKGIGTQALGFCVGLARHLNDGHRHDAIGCRFVTVDAYPKSAPWYMRQGFIRNGRSKSDNTVSLRFDVLLPD